MLSNNMTVDCVSNCLAYLGLTVSVFPETDVKIGNVHLFYPGRGKQLDPKSGLPHH